MKNRKNTCRKFYLVNCKTVAKSALNYSVGLYNVLNDKSEEVQKQEYILKTDSEKEYQETDLEELKKVMVVHVFVTLSIQDNTQYPVIFNPILEGVWHIRWLEGVVKFTPIIS